MKTVRFFAIIMWFIVPTYSYAQSTKDTVKLKLDLPLFDLSYQKYAMDAVGRGFFGSYANPSMNQSLAISTNLYSSFHFGMKQFRRNSKIRQPFKDYIFLLGITSGNLIMIYLPGGEGWLHEEFHRAVMTRHGANSFNGMNRIPIGTNIISVSKVKDEDLIRIKKKNPADMVRLHVAGVEGQYLLINNLQRNNFFYNKRLPNLIHYWTSTINSHAYIFLSASPNFVDKETAKMNEKELTIASRDFTGFDYTAWVYDLFRPNEPYEARGVHPSGVGINRYRTTKDLTSSELRYLKRQGYWHFLNYLSPTLLGIENISIGNSGLTGNFAMRHLLTSFGTAISAHVYLKRDAFKMAFAYHNYLNYQNYFPAIETELIDYKFHLGNFGMYLSPRTIIGMQPRGQEFKSSKAEFLGLLGLRVDFITRRQILPYIDFSAKTNGWVAGNEFLNSNTSLKMGVSARF